MSEDPVFLIANGNFSASISQIDELRRSKCLIAVDGGLHHCQSLQLLPHLIIGDFDSASAASLTAFVDVPKLNLQRDKDKTDLEVAIEYALQHTTGSLRIFGALGKRTDHTLYNLYLLTRYRGQITMESHEEKLFVLDRQSTIACYSGQTLSLLPLNGPVNGICTEGLKWELKDAIFDKSWMSISNICLRDPVTISIKQGNLLCCLEF